MNELIGIVACGGKSSRMGEDKSRICYHEKEQRYVVYELLSQLCISVFISCNSSQSASILPAYSYLVDAPEYNEMGPMAALLTAYKNFPQASFMLIGCDYPRLQMQDLLKLKAGRNEVNNALCYSNPKSKMNEPLLAIYENNCFPILLKQFEKNQFSLRYFLDDLKVKVLFPDFVERIVSIDTPEQVKELQQLKIN